MQQNLAWELVNYQMALGLLLEDTPVNLEPFKETCPVVSRTMSYHYSNKTIRFWMFQIKLFKLLFWISESEIKKISSYLSVFIAW